jgi:hypothetical protein
MIVNRMRYGRPNTILGMAVEEGAIRKVLWANVRALMVKRYGGENLNRLAREAKIGPGSATRIKECQTNVGLGVLEKLARHFEVEPWQLLAPGLSDEEFLGILSVWQETDGRGRRMLLTAAEGAKANYDVGTVKPERTPKAQRG